MDFRKKKNDMTVTDIDGNVYKTVAIGNQIWMAENLKVTRLRDGRTLKFDYDYYYNDEESRVKYGNMYSWEILEDLAPEGWHVPSVDEWSELTDALGGNTYSNESAGTKLKSREGWIGKGNGNNESGFNALPGGVSNGSLIGEYSAWWTDSLFDAPSFAWYVYLSYQHGFLGFYDQYRDQFFYVRCVKD
jgi:uncharacterized protein (TIGR02145 family)